MSPTVRRPRWPLALLIALCLTTVALAAGRAPAAPTAGVGRYILAHTLAGNFTYGNLMVVDPATGRVYRSGIYQESVIVIDTLPTPAIEEISLYYPIEALALSPDGRRLYLADVPTSPTDRHITIIDTATLTISDSFDYTCGEGVAQCALRAIAAGPADRLYLAFAYPAVIDVYDANAGQPLARLDHPGGEIGQIAAQGNNLYTLAGPSADSRNALRRFDITDATPVLKTTVPQPFPTPNIGPDTFAVAPNGAFVVVWNKSALRLDPLSLTVTGHYAAGDTNTVEHVLISPAGDEVTLTDMSADVPIHTFDALSGDLRRVSGNLDLTHDRHGFVALPNHHLANVSPDQLRVFLAHDYLAAAPLVLSGFCGGLFIDDFSDPTSGWPVADRGTVVYSYAYNQYHGHHYAILHRVPDAWSGVSRGDTWQGWPSLTVQTTIAQGVGSTGLIFGLNDDWSHFYSFEIMPELRRWALYFYTDGWHIWATEEYDGIMPTGSFSLLGLKPTPDGQLELQINYNTVFTFPEIPAGRVGLGAGSFYEGVGHTYDNFTIEPGPNCRPSDQSARPAVEQSPVLPRPPLPAAP